MTVWTVGNAAKLYALNVLATYADTHPAPFSVLDLGCGAGLNFVKLLEQYPQIHFVGIEPAADECAKARRNLAHVNATIVEGYAYSGIRASLPQPAYDFVVSFSVLEHVYRRQAYFAFVADCLAPTGRCLMNYDAGHFIQPDVKERLKTLLGPLLAQLGDESRYQAFVYEADVTRWAASVGLHIEEGLMFNTALKGVYKTLPKAAQEDFMERWLELELWLNKQGPTYHDGLAATWRTRSLILRRSD